MRIKFDQRTKKASFKLGYTMKDTFANLNRMYVGKNKKFVRRSADEGNKIKRVAPSTFILFNWVNVRVFSLPLVKTSLWILYASIR